MQFPGISLINGPTRVGTGLQPAPAIEIFNPMLELGPKNVIDYLRSTGRAEPSTPTTAEWLTWGVSNVVLRIHPQPKVANSENDIIVKQSRKQLRTETDWFSRLDRIYREADVMKCLAPLLPKGVVPDVLFEDRPNYLFAMQAVDADHVVWKSELLAGRTDDSIAARLGEYLSAIHAKTYDKPSLRDRFGDREIFDQLRIDPFYRHIAAAHSDIRGAVERMIDETFAISVCVVHADFSPKNILIANNRITLVDYETGHFGDPAFDLGFFLSHLLLKAVLHANRSAAFIQLARTFWNCYLSGIETLRNQTEFSEANLDRRTIAHLAGCMLSRVDGKSPVDYLPLPSQRDFVRTTSRQLFLNPPERLETLLSGLEDSLKQARFEG